MVQADTSSAGGTRYKAYNGPPSENNMMARKVSALALAVLLYSAAVPFHPVGWFFNIEGAFFVDRMAAGIILLCACYFQWRIASLTHALAIPLPNLSGGGPTIRNGRVGGGSSGGADIFLYTTNNYWPYAACEALLLGLAEFGPSEYLRRGVVMGIVAGLWILGWHATPAALKRWAWEHIKAWWFWIILSELLNVGRPTMARRARRF
jgi:hypothetical protein